MEENPPDKSHLRRSSAEGIMAKGDSYADCKLSSCENMPKMNFSSFDNESHEKTDDIDMHKVVEHQRSSTEGDESSSSLSTSGYCNEASAETKPFFEENQLAFHTKSELLPINASEWQDKKFHLPKVDVDDIVLPESTSSLPAENTDSKCSSLDSCTFEKVSADDCKVPPLRPPSVSRLCSSESSLDKSESLEKDNLFELGLDNDKELDILTRQQISDTSLVSGGGTERDDSEFDENSDEDDIDYLTNEEEMENSEEINRADLDVKKTEHMEVSYEKKSCSEANPYIFDLKDESLGKSSIDCEPSLNEPPEISLTSKDDIPKKKKKRKKKHLAEGESESAEKKEKRPKKKRKKEDETDDASKDQSADSLAKRTQFERRNIRKIFDEDNLDEETKAAQKEEMERRQRLQEIQEKLRQQALELRAQREQEMQDALEQLKNSALKSLLEDKERSPPDSPLPLPGKLGKLGKPPTGADIIDISSSSDEEEDSDSIIMMTEDEEEEEDDEEDMGNSGSHVNDAVNQRDAMGGVLVNVGHPPNDPDIYLAPQLAAVVKPHQIGGIRFLYDNVIESIERFKTSNGLGCILAHSMGLGKTLQVISFVDVFLRHTGAKNVLIIVPVNTLQNWVNEFNMWLPVAPSAAAASDVGPSVNSGNVESANAVDSGTGSSNGTGCGRNGESGTGENSNCDASISMGSVNTNAELPVEEKVIQEIDRDLLWPREFKVHVITDNMKNNSVRSKVVAEWHNTGGVLLLGYEMYRLLSTKRVLTSAKRADKRKGTTTTATSTTAVGADPSIIDLEKEDLNKELLKGFHEALVKPGPDLVICDEGHRIKNSHATISQALKNIRTKRRVVLTGYPLQNNLIEYWCMVDFTRPNYLGTRQEFCNMFERPIMNGQCKDSTPEDIKLMRFRSHVLHSLLEGFVQRRGHAVLRNSLPEKTEYVILVRMSPVQRKLYNAFMQLIKEGGLANWANSNNPIKAFSVFCKIWNHPDILHQVVNYRKDDNDLDIEEAKPTDITSVPSTPTGLSLPNAVPSAANPKRSRAKAKTKSKASAKTLHPSASAPVLTKSSDNNLGVSSSDAAGTSGGGIVAERGPSDLMSGSWGDNGQARMTSVSSSSWTDSVMPRVSSNVLPSSWSDNFSTRMSGELNSWSDNASQRMPGDFMSSSWNSNSNAPSRMSESMPPSPWSNSVSSMMDMTSNMWGNSMSSDMPRNQWMDNGSHHVSTDMSSGPWSNRMPNDLGSNYWGDGLTGRIPSTGNIAPGQWGETTSTRKHGDLTASDHSLIRWNSSEAEIEKVSTVTASGATSGGSMTVATSCADVVVSGSAAAAPAIEDSKAVEKVPSTDEVAAPAPTASAFDKKEAEKISYDWATELMSDYVAGVIEHSGKMVILMEILEKCIELGEKMLVFSQSLLTLTLIEEYLSKRIVPNTTDEYWAKNRNYFRLDGSTNGTERERLINLFNAEDNDKVHIFLLSTRAGCLGINLIGASRVLVFDASWNPCHDCQAVCRVYRYGQSRCCYVYRLVTDNTMEKNIYDRQINKQGISDRIVDELNPQNLLERKQVDMLLRYEDIDLPVISPEGFDERCSDPVLVGVVNKFHSWITKEPFSHESLLLDQQDTRLTKREKRLAQQGYEMDKKMANRPSYYPRPLGGGMPVNVRYNQTVGGRPIASVRPMMSTPLNVRTSQSGSNPTRLLIPAGRGVAGLKPGVSLQQIQTTTDILIPGTNTSTDSGPSKIPAGEKVLVIKTPKGVYIRTNQGKIFAVRTAPKVGATTTLTTSSATASSSVTKATTTSVSTIAKGGGVVLTTSTMSTSKATDTKKNVPVVRPLIRTITSTVSSSTGSRMPLSIIRTSMATTTSVASSATKSIRHVIPVSSATIVKPLTTSGSSTVVVTTKDAGVSWSAAASLPGARSMGMSRQNRMAAATRVPVSRMTGSNKAVVNIVQTTNGETQLTVNKNSSSSVGPLVQVKPVQDKTTAATPVKVSKLANNVEKVVTSDNMLAASGASRTTVSTTPATVVRLNESNKSVAVTSSAAATVVAARESQSGGTAWNTSGQAASSVGISASTSERSSDFDGLFTGALVDDLDDMAPPGFNEFCGSFMQNPVQQQSSVSMSMNNTMLAKSVKVEQSSMSHMHDIQQRPTMESFVDNSNSGVYPNTAMPSHHVYQGQHPMQSMQQQYPPMAPYGMPSAPYPWMGPPAPPMNPMWMQQPMSMGGPVSGSGMMGGPVSGSGMMGGPSSGSGMMGGPSSGSGMMSGPVSGSGLNRQHSAGASYGSSANDAFDFLSDGANFEPLGFDSGQSLTALLADSEPPPTYESSLYGSSAGISMNRRNISNRNNNVPMMGGPGSGYMPSYPAAGMMGGYPYNPYVTPMPYNPMGPQQGHYYPQPGSSGSYGNAPGAGGYFPMHYPTAMSGMPHTGMYSGGGANSGYMQPPNMMPHGSYMPSSHSMPGDINEFRMKTE